MSRRRKITAHSFLMFLSSLQISVVGLLLLFILTFWGTVAQVQHGLYAAQERYFSSFYFLAMGFFPFPGAQLVLWILFINLCCALFNRVKYTWENTGLIIVHYGLVLFFVSAFVIFHCAQESHLTLREGQTANVSQSYAQWEVALWPKTMDHAKNVLARSLKNNKAPESLSYHSQDPSLDLNFTVKAYYPNARAFSAPFAGIKEKYLNASNLNVLKPVPVEKEPEKNVAGIILQLEKNNKPLVLLYGAEEEPTLLTVDGKEYYLSLRHTHFPLPVTVTLIDFIMDKHPGTEIARSYKSRVEIMHDGVSREILISMNEPLRFKNYTFYQASYQIDALGREASTLAVVKNSGRILPYIATFVTFFGLALHFLFSAFRFQRTRK